MEKQAVHTRRNRMVSKDLKRKHALISDQISGNLRRHHFSSGRLLKVICVNNKNHVICPMATASRLSWTRLGRVKVDAARWEGQLLGWI